jgi:hypothetical protein
VLARIAAHPINRIDALLNRNTTWHKTTSRLA